VDVAFSQRGHTIGLKTADPETHRAEARRSRSDVACSRFGLRQGRRFGTAPWVLAEIEKQFGLEYSTLHPSHIFSFVALRQRFESELVSLYTIPLSLRALLSSNFYT
jgi:hypothetical protein